MDGWMNPSCLTLSDSVFKSRLYSKASVILHPHELSLSTACDPGLLTDPSPNSSSQFSAQSNPRSASSCKRNSVFPKLYFSTPEPMSHSSPLYFIYKIFQYTAVLVGLLKTCQRNAGNGKNIPQRPSIPPHIHQSCPAQQGGSHLECVNSDY